jgi:hypothetical protein
MTTSFKISKDSLTNLLSIIDTINEVDEVIVEDKGKVTIRLKPDIKDNDGNYVADNFFRLKCLFSDKQRPMKQHIKFDSINLDLDFKRNFL